jgi:tetratricopeptide (TPR) repeat protein
MALNISSVSELIKRGNNAYFRGEFNNAIEFNEKALDIARENKDKKSEGEALYNLGNAYYSFGEMNRAISDYYGKALDIAREIKDKPFEGVTLNFF